MIQLNKEPFVLCLFVVCIWQLVSAFILKQYLISKPTAEEEQLIKECRKLRVEEKRLNFPATFVEWAKVSRKANKIQKLIETLEQERTVSENRAWKKSLRLVLKAEVPFILFFGYFSTYFFTSTSTIKSGSFRSTRKQT
eukprot:maker-scaffold_4-snap-gene-14.11-mRNA-1 protein AED:0.38 eAED:0.38 QI:68/0.5/0.33/1/1/1/3/0/138